MPNKKAAKAIKATKKIIAEKVEEQKLMPNRPGLKYMANMDNVLIEGFFAEGSSKDETGKYVQPHLREVVEYVIVSVGPMVHNAQMKKGARVIPVGTGKITAMELDEKGIVGSIKPHDILAVIVK